MTDTPIQKFLDALYQANGQQPRQRGNGWMACCPAHDDQSPSLSINPGDDGRALVKCFAGCTTADICQALGFSQSDLMPPREPRPTNGKPRIVTTYDYRDENGQLLYQVCRMAPKTFRQRKPDGKGRWNWSVKGIRQVPYRLPELLAVPSRGVVIVEGEKDADRLARLGLLATCNTSGAGKWRPEFAEHFRGRAVVILPDNDDPGQQHADAVARSLQGIVASVRIINLPGLPPKGDVSDWLDAGGTIDQLRELIKAASEWTPAADWPEIDSLDGQSIPAFPADALPEPLHQWVIEESHATQTPADLPGLMALAVCSACIAKQVEVQPRDGWREPVNLYAAVILDPGNRKSAVFSDAIKPLEEIETELIEAARPSVAREQSERRQLEKTLKQLEDKAAKGDAQARHEAGQVAEELAGMPEPVLPCLIADDCTEEALGRLLALHSGRIASLSPEGGVFDLMGGKYTKNGSPSFTLYLKAHAGENPRTNRVTREAVRIDRPALTCGYTIQPAVIRGLADNPAMRGRGLLARFLYAAPASWIGHRQISPTPMAQATKAAYRDIVRQLSLVDGETVLQLTPEAHTVFLQWETEIEAMLQDGGELECLRDWGGKLAGATLRLAAVLHCVKHRGPIGAIDADTMTAAITLGRYLIPHADAVFGMMAAREESFVDDARYILRWIQRHDKREFSKTEAQHAGKRRFPKADDIDAGLEMLSQRGYIRLQPHQTNGPGRPPSPRFEVNPAIFENHNAKNRSQYSRNSKTEAPNGDLRNNGNAFGQNEDQKPAGDSPADDRWEMEL